MSVERDASLDGSETTTASLDSRTRTPSITKTRPRATIRCARADWQGSGAGSAAG